MSRCLFTSILLASAGWALAQTSPEPDPLTALLNTPVEVGSTRSTTLLRSPSTVTVMERRDLETWGVLSLAEALDLMTGIRVARGVGQAEIATIRGVLQESWMNRVLLLINGVPTWQVATGDAVLGRVPIEDIERVEVLRGPASVIYGTNAYAGAINVVLRKAVRNGGEGRASLTSRGGHSAGALGMLLGPRGSLVVSAHQSDLEGRDRDVPDETGLPTRMNERRLFKSAQVQARVGSHRLMFQAFESQTTCFGAAVSQPSGMGNLLKQGGLLGDYRWTPQLTDTLSLRLGATLDQNSRRFPFNSQGTQTNTFASLRQVAEATVVWEPEIGRNLEAGIAYQRAINHYLRRMDEPSGAILRQDVPPGVSTAERSAFLQARIDLGACSLQVGTRYTDNQGFGPDTSSRVALLWNVAPRQSLKLTLGQAFRAPTVFDRLLDSPGVLVGNPQLRPEKAQTMEVQYLGSVDQFFWQATVFHSCLRDKIIRGRLPDLATPTFVNGPSFMLGGAELELRYQGSHGEQVQVGLDWNTGDRGDESPLSRGYNALFIPALLARAGYAQRLGDWTASIMLRHQGPATGTALEPIPSATTVDLNLQTRHRWQSLDFTHQFYLKNANQQERWTAEVVRRNLNALPEGMGRQAGYSVKVAF